MRHRHHDPVDTDDDVEHAHDYTVALFAAYFVLALIALGLLLGAFLLLRGR